MAITGIENGVGPDSAAELVNEAWDYYRNLGNTWVAQASQAIGDLSSVQIQPISFSVDYTLPAWAPQFVRPTKPTTPTFGQITFDAPQAPTLDAVAVPDVGLAPAEPDFDSMARYAPPSAPTQPMPAAPTDVLPVLEDITVALPPDYVLPELPDMYALQLPAVPSITIPEFDGVRPTFDISMPEDGALDFVEVAHDKTLQNELLAQIRYMMQGGLGLPVAVEQSIFDRGRAREDQLTKKQLQEVEEDMAERGMTEPNGILARRLRQVRADGRTRTSELNRDLTIETAKIAVENMRVALGQGMALEQALIQQNLAINDRALRAAIFVREYGITRVNAMIAYANLQQQAYATDAQVWRTRIEGLLSTLELYKAQIEGQRLVGEVNKQLVERYEAGVRAVGEIAQIYRTNVEAAKVRGEINVQRIDAAKLILQRYDTQVNAWGKLQDGYRTQVEAAIGTARFAETMANVYATRMQGYKIKGDVYFQQGRFQLDRNAQTIAVFQSNLEAAEADLRAQLAAVDADVRAFTAQVGLYQADGQIAQAESAAFDRAVSLRIENERNRTTVELEQARVRVTQAMEIGKILVSQIEAKARALSQLAAASQSGVNFGASMSDSFSYGFSKSANVGWNGDAPDLTLTPAMAF